VLFGFFGFFGFFLPVVGGGFFTTPLDYGVSQTQRTSDKNFLFQNSKYSNTFLHRASGGFTFN